MLQIVLISLSAAAGAALLFAAVVTGSIGAALLTYLAPLPLLIVALGWGPVAALFAGVGAAAGLALVVSGSLALAFLIGVALPACWLGHLALLARPAPPDAGALLDWYPIGRLVLWAAVIGGALVVLLIPSLGTDKEGFQGVLRNALEAALGLDQGATAGTPPPALDRAAIDRVISVLVAIVAPAAAALVTLVNVANLWLAGKAVMLSGRLRRPWPELMELRLPPFAPALAAAALAGAFLPAIVGAVSAVFAASLLAAFALSGFAVLHALTRHMTHRTIVLGGVYAVMVLFIWPVMVASLLGLADAAFDFRRGRTARPGPPTRAG